MRIRTRIEPFPGEKLLELLPPPAAFAPDAPLRRLHFFPGRHLTDRALQLEQGVRVARLLLRARGVAPGVVTGLECGLDTDARGSVVRVGTGYGLTASGQDVCVDRVLRVPWRDLPVLKPDGSTAPWRTSAAFSPADILGPGSLARRVTAASDAVAAWLKSRLSRALLDMLAAFDPDTTDPAPVRAAVAAALNALIRDERLDTVSAFAEVALSAETTELLASRPAGRALERLNRMLLEDAFPLELAPDRFDRLGRLPPNPAGASAGVLLLVPGQLEELEVPAAAKAADRQAENFQPFERDPADEAYYRRTTVDAARLVLLPLSADVFPGWRLPPLTAPGRWRNEVAWSVFAAEQRALPAALLGPDEAPRVLPWEAAGVAVALVGLDEFWQPLFLDRHAVARQGGRPRQRVLTNRELARQRGGVGEPRLWQARVDQFAAELAGHHVVEPGAARFRWLPPFGVLPRAFFETPWREVTVTVDGKPRKFRTLPNRFFPSNYAVQLAVAPLEQLDAVAAATRGLDPFDLDQPDRVMLLAPVPQAVFDPQLLEVEEVSPEFAQAVKKLSAIRNDWLGRRADLRSKAGALHRSLTKQELSYDDPGKLDPDEPDPPPAPGSPESAYGTTRDAGGELGDANALVSQDCLALQRELGRYLFAFTEAEQKELTDLKLDDYLKRQRAIQEAEAAALRQLGLRRFIELLEDKVRRADDLLDGGFLRLSADVYRLGQLLNTNALGTKFAVSDALAGAVARPAAPTPGAANLFTSTLVANLAPPGLKSAATEARARPLPTTHLAAHLAEGGALAGGASATSARLGDFLTMATEAAKVLETEPGRTGLAKLQDLTSNDPTARAALDALVKAGAAAAQPEARAQVAELSRVKQFGEAYVPNFNQITARQIRVLPLDRLQPALAPQIRQDVQDRKLEIFDRLQQLDLSLAGLTSEFVDADPAPGEDQPPVRRLSFTRLLTRRQADVLDPADADEAKHFAAGAKHADMAAAALRAVATRVRQYRELIARGQEVLRAVEAQQQQLAARLHVVDGALAEARHDVAVAKALLAEETARVAAVNRHRQDVLDAHVTFFVFHRPRAVETRLDGPVRSVHPALVEPPVPAALREALPVPPDLQALQEVFRDSPARWFRLAPQWLAALDRLPELRELVVRVTGAAAPESDSTYKASAGRYSATLARLLSQRAAVAATYREQRRLALPAGSLTASLQDLQREVRERFTLRDLLDHGPAALARPAAEELERVFRVAAALHRDFSHTPGALRLVWAEQFSQFDAPASFRDLGRLPRWDEVEFTLRRQMQWLADWLYDRVDASEPGAVGLVDDLVRVCLLLASHAPVDQLVTGRLAEPVTPAPAATLKIRVDAARVRLGMGVVLDLGQNRLVRAVVSNLTDTEAHARITTLPAQPVGQIPADTAVRFHEAGRPF
jgi:hypothetical protein